MNDLQTIRCKIYEKCGQRVMLDCDLAVLYGVETKALKQAVGRNIRRCPEDFMFEVTPQEVRNSRSQNGALGTTENQEITELRSQFVTLCGNEISKTDYNYKKLNPGV